MPALRIAAPAKLNLSLEILGRRPDGFHDLETIFQTIDLADRLDVEVAAGAGIVLTCSDPELTTGPGNLVHRAAAAYLARRPLGRVVIHLDKRIPSGAGLGGGSSDAAATLRALAGLDPQPLPMPVLMAIGAELGSDVPFFLIGGTAHAGGRGERLAPLPDLPPLPLTVLMPADARCPTPDVYRALTEAERGPRPPVGVEAWARRLSAVRHAEDLRPLLGNRMTAAAIRVAPQVGILLDRLAGQPAPFLMSGSGAACFALAAGVAPPPGARAWPARLLGRDQALSGCAT